MAYAHAHFDGTELVVSASARGLLIAEMDGPTALQWLGDVAADHVTIEGRSGRIACISEAAGLVILEPTDQGGESVWRVARRAAAWRSDAATAFFGVSRRGSVLLGSKHRVSVLEDTNDAGLRSVDLACSDTGGITTAAINPRGEFAAVVEYGALALYKRGEKATWHKLEKPGAAAVKCSKSTTAISWRLGALGTAARLLVVGENGALDLYTCARDGLELWTSVSGADPQLASADAAFCWAMCGRSVDSAGERETEVAAAASPAVAAVEQTARDAQSSEPVAAEVAAASHASSDARAWLAVSTRGPGGAYDVSIWCAVVGGPVASAEQVVSGAIVADRLKALSVTALFETDQPLTLRSCRALCSSGAGAVYAVGGAAPRTAARLDVSDWCDGGLSRRSIAHPWRCAAAVLGADGCGVGLVSWNRPLAAAADEGDVALPLRLRSAAADACAVVAAAWLADARNDALVLYTLRNDGSIWVWRLAPCTDDGREGAAGAASRERQWAPVERSFRAVVFDAAHVHGIVVQPAAMCSDAVDISGAPAAEAKAARRHAVVLVAALADRFDAYLATRDLGHVSRISSTAWPGRGPVVFDASLSGPVAVASAACLVGGCAAVLAAASNQALTLWALRAKPSDGAGWHAAIVATSTAAPSAGRRRGAARGDSPPCAATCVAVGRRNHCVAVLDASGSVAVWRRDYASSELFALKRVSTIDPAPAAQMLSARWLGVSRLATVDAAGVVRSYGRVATAAKRGTVDSRPRPATEAWVAVDEVAHAVPLTALAAAGDSDDDDEAHDGDANAAAARLFAAATRAVSRAAGQLSAATSTAADDADADDDEDDADDNDGAGPGDALFSIGEDGDEFEAAVRKALAPPGAGAAAGGAAASTDSASRDDVYELALRAKDALRGAREGLGPLCGMAVLAVLQSPRRGALAHAARADAVEYLGAFPADSPLGAAAASGALGRRRLAWWAPTGELRQAYEGCAAALMRGMLNRAKRPKILGANDDTTSAAAPPSPAAATALLYVAAGKRATLQSFAKAEGTPMAVKLVKLLAFDFTSDRGRIAAQKNAYALLAKHDYDLAATCFLLAQPPFVEDAARVAVEKLGDVDLAFGLARLCDAAQSNAPKASFGALDAPPAETDHFCAPKRSHASKVLRRVILPYLAQQGDDAMAAVAHAWLGRTNQALAALEAAAASAGDAAAAPPPRDDWIVGVSRRAPLAADALDDDVDDALKVSAPAAANALAAPPHVALRIALRAARAALRRGAPDVAARILAEAAPHRAAAETYRPPRPVAAAAPRSAAPPAPSALDGFDAAPQRAPQKSIFDDFEAAPQRSALDGFDAAPQRAPPRSALDGFDAAPPRSALDGFDAAPQRAPQQRSALDGFDAAPPRSALDGFDAAPQRAPQRSALDGFDAAPRSALDGFDASPQRAPQRSALDGFDAASQRAPQQRSALDGFDAAPPRSALDGFDAAPQRAPPQRSALDGFDAAPPRSALDGFDAAPQRAAPPRSTPGVSAAAPQKVESEDDDSGDDSAAALGDLAELDLWLADAALDAAARLLAQAVARVAALDASALDGAAIQRLGDEAKRLCAAHQLPRYAVAVGAARHRRRRRRLTAAILVVGATRHDGELISSAAAKLVGVAARRAMRFAALPGDAQPQPRDAKIAARACDDLVACVRLSRARSHALAEFVSPALERACAAAQRGAALCRAPQSRARVLALMLRRPLDGGGARAPDEDASPRRDGAAFAAAVALRHGDAAGWQRLEAVDRRGAEQALRDAPLGTFVLRPQQQLRPPAPGDESPAPAAIAISFVVLSEESTPELHVPCIQHAVIRVHSDGSEAPQGLEYSSGKLGPRGTLVGILEEISDRLQPHGLLLGDALRPGSRVVAPAVVREDAPGPKANKLVDFQSALQNLADADRAGPAGEHGARNAAVLDVLSAAALLGELRPSSGHRRDDGVPLAAATDAYHDAAAAADDDAADAPAVLRLARRGRRATRRLLARLSPGVVAVQDAERPAADEGHIIAQLLHPNSGVALEPPKAPLGWGAAPRAPAAVLVSAAFSPTAAAAWLVDHAHDAYPADARARLQRWQQERIVALVGPNGAVVATPPATPKSVLPRAASSPAALNFAAAFASAFAVDDQLRFIDAWEVEPLDDDDAAALLRPALLGRHKFAGAAAAASARAAAPQSELWRALGCDAWLVAALSAAFPPAALCGDDELDDAALAQAVMPWPPAPAARKAATPPATPAGRLSPAASPRRPPAAVVGGAVEDAFRCRLRRHMYRNALLRRAGLRQRFVALVRVQLVALEQLDATGGAAPRGAKCNAGAYAILRLRQARPPGAGPAPALSERLRTRDSAVAARPAGAVPPVGPAAWGVSASFRFALPDEALPLRFDDRVASGDGALGALPRMPTRGPPDVVHVCVSQRVTTPLFAAMGLPPTETALGDVEVPLSALADDAPLVQWLPLRGGGGAPWFVRVRVALRFVLQTVADDDDRPPPRQTGPPRTPPSRSFSEMGLGAPDSRDATGMRTPRAMRADFGI
ncbi:hypothetical protein M885DRAFT_585630 [Pelagophyceae sp. CCMP2097]|nr:hypothetical protein M885DRAFT_585630 [Pelagophyceae sp. CCMP2097]